MPADGHTANLNLTKPEVGASGDSWGSKQNDAFDKIDAVFAPDGSGTAVGLYVGDADTLVVTGTAAIDADALLIKDPADRTKIVQFDVSGIATSTTRTLKVPDKNTTLAGVDDLGSTGDLKAGFWTSAPTGFALCSGRTIGDGSSGGTERANADTAALFTLLWTNQSNTLLPIQDSSGAASTRGVSAAADYAAHKRLPLPDLRGRTLYGVGNMGGTESSRLNSQITTGLGQAGGAQQTNTSLSITSSGNNNIGVSGTLAGSVVSNSGVNTWQDGPGGFHDAAAPFTAGQLAVSVGGSLSGTNGISVSGSANTPAFSTTSPGIEVNYAIRL